jgi:phenylalanyl-tRNA synthetase beta chain
VIHECDILEDIAICYGYKKIVPILPPSATVGSRLRLNKFTDMLRHEMAQGQFNEELIWQQTFSTMMNQNWSGKKEDGGQELGQQAPTTFLNQQIAKKLSSATFNHFTK